MSGSLPGTPETQSLPLPDGRQVAYACYGKSEGLPVFYFHGLPGSRYECQLADAPARALGLRVVAPDRPGYGLSPPDRDGSLRDWTADVGALADALGVDTFTAIGVSGGAPCALACAHEMPHRVTAVTLVAGLGPVHETLLRRDMSLAARLSFFLARKAPGVFSAFFEQTVVRLAARRPDLLVRLIATLDGGPDKATLLDPPVFQAFSFSIRECFRQGTAGSLKDLQVFQQPWGFALEDIRQPVRVWHGTRDRVVPQSHSRHVAHRLPGAELTVVPDEGHFSLPLRHLHEILETAVGCNV
jgi:pimeloyl-ACP methyl ester carboxylesterase